LILAPLEQLAAAGNPGPDYRLQLERMQRNALLLLNRVNDILDLSKAEAGKFNVRWEAVNLCELVPALGADAAAAAENKGCTLDWQVDPTLEAVRLDRQLFEKIALNFISNALKVTPAGGSIRLEARTLDDQSLEFAVTDSGHGVPADKQALLFKRFQQIDGPGARHNGGTGVGLALVKEFAELMGGTVGVQSESGRGARFFVRLPRNADRAVSPADAGAADAKPSRTETLLRGARLHEGVAPDAKGVDAATVSTPSSAGKARILVVDDNADMRSFIADQLRGECEVLTATDGLDAWERLQHDAVDAVVSDVMMPKLDGLGLTARIKASSALSHVPVILVTARGGAEAGAAGLESGADDYISKPFSPLELRARVRAALRMSQVQRELRDKSREAGIAMLASSVLHNLGNILNGVTVTSSVIEDKLHNSKVIKVNKVAELLQAHVRDLPGFFANDSRAQALPEFLLQLAEHLEAEHKALLKEVEVLRGCAEHAGGVIASQQQLAQPGTEVRELIPARTLIDTAIKFAAASFEMKDIAIETECVYTGAVSVDRHKALQILLNLLCNAHEALQGVARQSRRIRVRTLCGDGSVRMEVSDNGGGIDPQHLATIFNQGFTTKGAGHGYGLHSSANWARELGGSLICHSDGIGRGCTFTLKLPLPASAADRDALPASGSSAS
jgi:two-component system sensor histidine kinase ChiS